jgi:hypothetical protein
VRHFVETILNEAWVARVAWVAWFVGVVGVAWWLDTSFAEGFVAEPQAAESAELKMCDNLSQRR